MGPQHRDRAVARLVRARTEKEVSRTLGEIGVSIPTSDGEALVELRDQYRGIVRALWQLAVMVMLSEWSQQLAKAR